MFIVATFVLLVFNCVACVAGAHAFFADGDILKGLAGLGAGFLALICAYMLKGEFE